MGILLAGLVAVPVVMLVGVPAGYFLFVYGCGEQEDRLAETMAGDPVLDAGPAGAGKGVPYKGCDDDDLFVSVGREYKHGASLRSTLVHYREAAQANGWRPSGARGDDSVSDCFTKRMGGTTAYLTVNGPDNGTVRVEIIADRAGSDWC